MDFARTETALRGQIAVSQDQLDELLIEKNRQIGRLEMAQEMAALLDAGQPVE